MSQSDFRLQFDTSMWLSPPEELDREFADLDNEISRYESNVLTTVPVAEQGSAVKPIIRRIIASLKSRFADKHDSGGNSTGENSNSITCRLCENPVLATELESHTEWCSKFQDCVLKKVSCQHYLNALLGSTISECNAQVCEFVEKALEIDEQLGKSAAIRLAKLLYRVAKIDLGKETSPRAEAYLRRAKYLVKLCKAKD
jgi:hypothetical protein